MTQPDFLWASLSLIRSIKYKFGESGIFLSGICSICRVQFDVFMWQNCDLLNIAINVLRNVLEMNQYPEKKTYSRKILKHICMENRWNILTLLDLYCLSLREYFFFFHKENQHNTIHQHNLKTYLHKEALTDKYIIRMLLTLYFKFPALTRVFSVILGD